MAEFWHKVGGALLFYNLHYEKFADGTVKCIEDEIPFELPEGWKWCRLKDLFNVCSAKRVLQSEWQKEGIPFYRAREIVKLSNNGYVDNDLFISLAHYETLKKTYGVPQVGDLMVTGVGTIGKVYIVQENDTFYYKDASVLCFENRYGAIESEYARIMIDSPLLQEQIHSKTYGNTVDTITISTANNYLCVLPPTEEQRKIVEAVKNVLEIISFIEDGYTEIKSCVTQAKSKILDLAIQGKLVPQDPADESASVLLERIRAEKEELIKQGKIKRDKKESVIFKGEDNSYYEKIGNETLCIDAEIPFELPPEWVWCRGYSCFSGMETKRPDGESFRYIDIDSIDNKAHKIKHPKIIATKDAPSRASRAVQTGSVLFSFVRPYLENIAYVSDDSKDCIASTGFYVCNSNGMLYPPFMYYLMISEYVVQGLNQFMKGDNSPSISKDNIENWLYPIPPINEQKRICNKLEELFGFISKIEKGLI